MVESSFTKLYFTPKGRLRNLGEITLCPRIGDLSATTLFSAVDNLAINVLLYTTVIDYHVLATSTKERKATSCHSNLVAITEQWNKSSNAVLDAIDSREVTPKSIFKAGNSTKQVLKKSTIVQVSKEVVLDSLPVTRVMITMKVQGLLRFDIDYKLAVRRCLHARGTVVALSNRPVFIVLSNTLTWLQEVDKKAIEHLIDDKCGLS